ncbi:MAG: site-specific integrase, partial [Muribaculaceae bacterium]|nr:site-specific integrase [Muribaculaceae bacterium]
MASIKVMFRSSTVADREGTIYYQIIHERKVRQLLSDYKVFPSEWDASRSMVISSHKSERRSFILSVRERIRWDVERLTRIYRRLDANGLIYTADDVIDEFIRYAHEYSLFNYMEGIIAKLKQNGKVRTSETYKSALNSFKKFLTSRMSNDNYRQNDDIMLDSLTSEIMEAYEAWHRSRGVAPNTISFYTRILRAVYNRAVEDGIIENRNPFRHVYTGVDKTVKRALPLEVIKKIKMLDLSLTPSLDYARDMFMMSFYLRGMSFVDMAFLRKTYFINGYVIYRLRKTVQQL